MRGQNSNTRCLNSLFSQVSDEYMSSAIDCAIGNEVTATCLSAGVMIIVAPGVVWRSYHLPGIHQEQQTTRTNNSLAQEKNTKTPRHHAMLIVQVLWSSLHRPASLRLPPVTPICPHPSHVQAAVLPVEKCATFPPLLYPICTGITALACAMIDVWESCCNLFSYGM